jgi:hypothetical protein
MQFRKKEGEEKRVRGKRGMKVGGGGKGRRKERRKRENQEDEKGR